MIVRDAFDPRRLGYVASHFSQLRGFRQIACGVFLLLVFAAMEADNQWAFGLLAILFIALGLSFWRLGKYYEQRFGRVESPIFSWSSWSLRAGVQRFAFVAAIILFAIFLLRGNYGPTLFVPSVAAFIFFGFVLQGYPTHYLVLAAPYVLLAILHPAHPHWLGTVELWSIPLFFILGGLLDHRLLVRSLPGLPKSHHD